MMDITKEDNHFDGELTPAGQRFLEAALSGDGERTQKALFEIPMKDWVSQAQAAVKEYEKQYAEGNNVRNLPKLRIEITTKDPGPALRETSDLRFAEGDPDAVAITVSIAPKQDNLSDILGQQVGFIEILQEVANIKSGKEYMGYTGNIND